MISPNRRDPSNRSSVRIEVFCADLSGFLVGPRPTEEIALPIKDTARRAVKKTESELAKAEKAVKRGGRDAENELKKGGSALKKDARKLRRKV